MFFQIVMFVWQFVLDLVAVLRMTDDEKDLEIMLLRQQLRIVERKQARGPQIPRWQKVPLAALAVRLKDKASNAREALAESMRLFKPETVIGWHRAAVRRKWTFKQERKPGRPPIDAELERWIVRVAQERWLRLQPRSIADALELGYHAGNLHWRVRFAGEALLVAMEAPMDDYLARIGALIRDRRVISSLAEADEILL